MTDTKKQTETIRILITDDHAVVREGLRTLIGTEPGMEVVGEAAVRVPEEFQTQHPDVPWRDVAGLRSSESIRGKFCLYANSEQLAR